MAFSTYLADVWSATDFDDPALSGYAEELLRKDTRIGIQTMALLAFVMQVTIAGLLLWQDTGEAYLYTNAILAIFSLHILISAAFVNDVKSLHVLGISFLTIGAMAITFIAHRAGDLDIGMIAAIIMLFIAVPLVPWALRETIVVVGLTYLLLAASLISVPDRFDAESLWVLLTLALGTAMVVIVIAGRNTSIRKHDIRARFELESAHSAMELLSMQDHLTGAWNRRFLDEHFPAYARECAERNLALHVAVLDIDDFKGLNDRLGHQAGDKILVAVAHSLVRFLGSDGRLIRLGGDEFFIVYCGDELDDLICRAITEVQRETAALLAQGDRTVTLSAGIASTQPGSIADLDALYKTADRALYLAKSRRSDPVISSNELVRTGTWKL